ncbi:MAG: hypothetical protein HRU23_18990 [Gammaproteobacteria bacterium]|nr:hypothetical protein [Gammaproteobacteria bacterium]
MSQIYDLVSKLQESIDNLDAIIEGDESTTVNISGVKKGSIDKRIKDHFSELRALLSGRVSFRTRAELLSTWDLPNNTLAEVWGDNEKTNNGLYGFEDNSWTKSKYDHVSLINEQLVTIDTQITGIPNLVNQTLESSGIVSDGGSPLVIVDAVNLLKNEDKIQTAYLDNNDYAALMFTEKGDVIIPILRNLFSDIRTLTSQSISGDRIDTKVMNVSGGDIALNGLNIINGNANYDVAFVDDNGNVGFGYINGELVTPAPAETDVEAQLFDTDEYNYDFAVTDENGNVSFGVKNGKLFKDTTDDIAAIQTRDAQNISNSLAFSAAKNHEFAGSTFKYNTFVVAGQSLSVGAEGWPHLSRNQNLGNLMIGDDTRQYTTTADAYAPVGQLVFKPLVANTVYGSSLLTDAEILNIVPGTGTRGEHVGVGMVNMAKSLFNQWRNTEDDTDHVFVNVGVGQGGRNITQLSKINTSDAINRYNWFLEALDAVSANAASESWGVTAILWMQGEDDYHSDNPPLDGPILTKLGYKAALKILHNDMVIDAALKSGQPKQPVFLTYQTGAKFTRDLDENGNPGLYIGMAQLEFTDETPGAVMAGPIYPYSDKGGHLDANGYRWYGQKLGQIYHKVVTLREQWQPLRPIKITQVNDNTLHVDFHVPSPPLVFKAPYIGDYYQGSELKIYANKGFSVSDDTGPLGIYSVEIIGQTIVSIKTIKPIGANPHVWYADAENYRGNGNLCDSDHTISLDKYEYRPEWGMYETANKEEFVNKHYPLENWCVAFYCPVGYELTI